MTTPPTPLDYATPPPPPRRRLARLPVAWSLLIAVAVPGFASQLLGAAGGGRRFATLSGTAVLSFVVFGPVWGELVFAGTPYANAGLIPFLVTWLATIVASVATAARDWQVPRRDWR